MVISRRDFLRTGAVIGGAAALSPTTPLAQDSHSSLATAALQAANGVVYTCGYSSHLFPPLYQKNQCILTELNTQTGRVRSVVLPIEEAHDIVVYPDEETLIAVGRYINRSVVLDYDLNVVEMIHAPESAYFSGHARYNPERKTIYFSVQSGAFKKGELLEYDREFQCVNRIETGGESPHDFQFLNGNEAVVGHYGQNDFSKANVNVVEIGTGAVKHSGSTAEACKAGHIAVRGNEVFALGRIEAKGRADEDAVQNIWKRLSELYQKNNIGHGYASQMTRSIHPIESYRKEVQMPTPVVIHDTVKGTTRYYMETPEKHLWGQSVVHHQSSGRVFGAYMCSEQLLVVEPDGQSQMLDSRMFNIQKPIGLSTLGETDLLAIGGYEEGISIIDAKHLHLVQHYPCQLYSSAHLTWRRLSS